MLCQLPQSAHDDRQARAWIETVGRALGDLSLAVEFRHRSWAGPETTAWMADLGLNVVAVDVPDLPGLYPRGWVQSGPVAYVRLHSRNKANWYRGDKERYDYDYDDAALKEWLDAAAAAAESGAAERALFLFNNCHRSQAAINAQRMQALAAGRPQFAVEPPAAEPAPVQRSLFDDRAVRDEKRRRRAGDFRNRNAPGGHYFLGAGLRPLLCNNPPWTAGPSMKSD